MKALPLFLLPALSVFADDSNANQGNFIQTLIMIGIFVVFFYVILWRPEQKRRKGAEEMRSALKIGDKVTAMGIIGVIEKIQEQTVILKMVDGGKIEVLKVAISDVQPGKDESSK